MTSATLLFVLALLVGQCLAASAQEATALHNARLRIAFSDRGAVSSLTDLATGRELIAAQASPRLFLLRFSQKGDTSGSFTYLSSADAQQVQCTVQPGAGKTTARLSFTNLGGQGVNVQCQATVADDDPFARWRISVQIPDGLVLESVQFPILVLRAPLGEGLEDAAVFGATKGGLHRGLSAWKENTRVAHSQPGNLAAQFACYYDVAGGLMMAALDAIGHPKSVELRRTTEGLAFAWSHECFASGTFALGYDVAVATFGADATSRVPTDWRNAADLYKQWALTQPWCAKTYAQREDIPDWLKDGPAMVRFSRQWLTGPPLIEHWLEGYWRKHFAPDIPLITAYWGWEKVATWVTPDYFPVFPSDEKFTALVKKSRSLGCHAFLWPSGYHYTLTYNKQADGTFAWDDRERFGREAERHAVQGRDGKALIGPRPWLQGGETATMCPGDPWTIEWFNEIGRQIARRGGEMVQVDQVVGGRFPACYSASHGHPPGPGPWVTEVFHRQLATLLQECRKIEPQAVVCFEEPNEWFIQQVAVQDYRDWEVMKNTSGPEPTSVFNYLYHEFLPTFQSNPQSGNKLMTAYCLVNGQIPHLVPQMLAGSDQPIPNGGFELWTGDDPVAWSKVSGYQGQVWTGKAFRDTTVKHGGQFSLRLENDADDQTVQVSQNIAVGNVLQVGKTYRLSAWLKSEGLAKANRIPLATFTSEMKSTGGASIPVPAPGDWQRGEAEFSVPTGSALLRIMLHISGRGKVWVDDVDLAEVMPDGSGNPVRRSPLPTDHDLMQQWVKLFHGEGRPYLLLGRMLHPPKLECGSFGYQGRTFPAILHNAFRAPDGSAAVVMVNATDEAQSGVLEWRGKREAVQLGSWEVVLHR